jgi:hypothetical protein
LALMTAPIITLYFAGSWFRRALSVSWKWR